MSVQISSFKTFQYIENGFIYAANNKVCDDLFSETVYKICRSKDFIEEAHRWIKNLIRLNSKTYAANYNDPLDDLTPFYKYEINDHPLNALQLIKSLECVQYNIDLNTIARESNKILITEEEREDFSTLCKFLLEIKDAYIHNQEQYKLLTWNMR